MTSPPRVGITPSFSQVDDLIPFLVKPVAAIGRIIGMDNKYLHVPAFSTASDTIGRSNVYRLLKNMRIQFRKPRLLFHESQNLSPAKIVSISKSSIDSTNQLQIF